MGCEVQVVSLASQWRSVSDGNCAIITFLFNVNVFQLSLACQARSLASPERPPLDIATASVEALLSTLVAFDDDLCSTGPRTMSLIECVAKLL